MTTANQPKKRGPRPGNFVSPEHEIEPSVLVQRAERAIAKSNPPEKRGPRPDNYVPSSGDKIPKLRDMRGRPMAHPELVMVRYGRCPSCGLTAFLWARSPRAKLKRCRVCLTNERDKPNGQAKAARAG